MTTLYLIRGIPGCGKSTLAKQMLDSKMVGLVVEADDFFNRADGYHFDARHIGTAHDICQDRTRLYLEVGVSVAVSNTSTTEREVETYRKIAEDLGVQFVSIVVENRHGNTNVHNVPEEKVQQMKNRFSVKL